MVSNLKKIVVLLIVFFLNSCEKEKRNEDTNPPTLQQEIYSKINSFIDSSNCTNYKVISVRYQKSNKKEFIQISAEDAFITDSLFILKEYKKHVIAFYNREFFKKNIIDNDINANTIKRNVNLDLYKNNSTDTGIPCFDMYELSSNGLIQVPKNSYYFNNLFTNPPMSEAPPPPVK